VKFKFRIFDFLIYAKKKLHLIPLDRLLYSQTDLISGSFVSTFWWTTQTTQLAQLSI